MKNSLWLKTICFIMLPIFAFIFICSIIYAVYVFEEPDYKNFVENYSYFETKLFSDNYKSNLENIVFNTNSYLDYFYMEINGINYSTQPYCDRNFNYLIINKKTNKICTNVNPTEKTDTVDKIKTELSNNKYYWNYINEIDTNINNLSAENISYTDYLYQIIEIGDYEVYSSVSDNLKYNDNFVFGKIEFTIINKIGKLPIVLIMPTSLVLIILICAYLTLSLGHRKNYEGIYLNYLDKLPFEILFLAVLVLGLLFSMFTIIGYPTTINDILTIIGIILFCIDLYICFAVLMSTIIKRIKAGTLFKNTLAYKFLIWMKKSFKKFGAWTNETTKLISSNINTTFKLAIIYFGFILGSISSIILILISKFALLPLVLALWVYVFILLVKKVNKLYKIKDAVHQIYEGNNDIKLDESEFSGDLVEMASDVNDIAGGFSNAIAENLKSERLKTELITNVSHDIKTPLTSIISYVDLLKQEDIKNEKAIEYINVLDNKSARLKRLIEDLVEASKASSGNIKLNKENLKVAELINQCIGEFEDRFKSKGLEIIANIPKEDLSIYADSRYMYRVIENVFSNITKYALENSRVYIDITCKYAKINISIKNISKDKLNISPDELMQRFVRGDKSRFTEGSGLGLSISKSLVELQGGKFGISIDGDLFKVNLSFDMIQSL